MKFKSLKELQQYEEFYKRKMKRQEDIKKMQGITPEKWEEMKKTNILISTQETHNKMILRDIEEQREQLIEQYINEEVERRLKEQQPSQEQIEKEVKPQIEKIIDDTFKNLKLK